MSMADAGPVLIVGAGPTGLTAALELSRMGVPVRIVDKSGRPAETSRALAVHARTLELLDQRGLAAEMVHLGNRARAASIHDTGRKLATIDLRRIPSRFNYVLLLAQSETERLLREQLARQGVTVEREVQLTSLTQLPAGGVRVGLRHAGDRTEQTDVPWLISADGAHSTVRRLLALPFGGESDPETYSLADLYIDGDVPDDQLTVFLAVDGFVALFPMGDRRFRMIATDPQHHAKDEGPPPLAELQGDVDRVTRMALRLRDPYWTSRFRINNRHLETLRAGNVFFGGDAAHVHSPVGGQGMNTGMHDMINLCWKLALVVRGRAGEALLDTYQEERLPIIKAIVRTTKTATNLFNSDSPLVHSLLSHTLPFALGTDVLQNRGTRILSELSADYRDSPLADSAGDDDAVEPLRAGDRVPDLMLITNEGPGARRRLYDLLDASRFTLLIISPDGGAVPERLAGWDDLVKVCAAHLAPEDQEETGADDDLLEKLTKQGGLLLVRPDAYLGVAAGPDRPDVLDAWLSRWFDAVPR